MSERPTLFSSDMVKALLAGKKTQTRRVLRPRLQEAIAFMDGDTEVGCIISWSEDGYAGDGWYVHSAEYPEEGAEYLGQCPYGLPGNLLWVRESWAEVPWVDTEGKEGSRVLFRADEPGRNVFDPERGDRWRPSIHMPRWASRIALRVTDVRVERLRDITEADAIAEGARRFDSLPSEHPYGQDARWSMEEPTSTDQCLGSARFAFANYWNKLNEKRGHGWDSNPWVWVVTFEVVG